MAAAVRERLDRLRPSNDTIFALSSGAPPAAIAVVRLSGPDALAAGERLAGRLPPARSAGLRALRDDGGVLLDRALVIAFPGPHTATGEDLVELHLHGGRAVVRAVETALGRMPGLRSAEPGEFTRRALGNGRIDLAEAEGLADLLAAESEAARRQALAASNGAVSRLAAQWVDAIIGFSARVEAMIDFADEDDVPAERAAVDALLGDLAEFVAALDAALARAPVERLHNGFKVVLAGPPNCGKSSLINALAVREVAITSPVAGTTRDRIEAAVQRDGIAYLFTDTAGLRAATDDPIEQVGIARARAAIEDADLVLWLGDEPPPAPAMLALHARCDVAGRGGPTERPAVSAVTGAGLDQLWHHVATAAHSGLPRGDEVAFNARTRMCIAEAVEDLRRVAADDLVLVAEHLRQARSALAGITGSTDIEAVLDALFGRFCIGK